MTMPRIFMESKIKVATAREPACTMVRESSSGEGIGAADKRTHAFDMAECLILTPPVVRGTAGRLTMADPRATAPRD